MLPRTRFGVVWDLELSSFDPELPPGATRHGARTVVTVPPHSTVVLKRVE